MLSVLVTISVIIIVLSNVFLEFINILLLCGADVKKTDDFGWNALQFACRYNFIRNDSFLNFAIVILSLILIILNIILGRYNFSPKLPEIIDLLLKHGTDVNSITTNKWNCLHQLCKYNSGEKLYQVISTLVRHGIDINAQTSKNDTVEIL
jgi:ankyrin repeat protein